MLNPGQGLTRWALEQRAAALRRHIPAATGERLQDMKDELAEIEDALDEDDAQSERDIARGSRVVRPVARWCRRQSSRHHGHAR